MAQRLSRRRVIRDLCGGVAAGWVSRLYGSSRMEAGQERNGSRAAMFHLARTFMEKYSVPGMAVSITRNGKFVYEHSFGMADRSNAQQLRSNSLFRIASVTKPITAVTIFTLIEQGKLNLNDRGVRTVGNSGNEIRKAAVQAVRDGRYRG